jgi:WhiB family redox-sensing transcriptional regulator
MFKSKLARELHAELMEASRTAPVIPPCQNTDPDAWFPETGPEAFYTGGELYSKVRKLCNSCPVKDLCLEYALVNGEEYGMWGGMTPRERQALRGRRFGTAGIKGRPRKTA